MANQVRFGKISDLYLRYSGSLAQELKTTGGMNASAHVASVRMDTAKPLTAGRSVVKMFRLSDRGWFNEYAAWTLAQHLEVQTSAYSAILVGHASDISDKHGPELIEAVKYVDEEIVLWCTSAVEPSKNVQAALGRYWQKIVLATQPGQRLAAMDGWIGNCDRIDRNALWWSSGSGSLVAIDHEKALFNHDWTNSDVPHLDEAAADGSPPAEETQLAKVITRHMKSEDKTLRKNARAAANTLFHLSQTKHSPTWDHVGPEICSSAEANFGTQARDRLVSFISYRVNEDCIKRRYGLTI